MQSETQLDANLFMDFDRSGPIPLYFQLAQMLEGAIHDGALPPGARLENEVSLAERLSLSRPTVRRAIQSLVDKGLLVRRRGIGTQVVHGQVSRGVELTSLWEDLETMGKTPSTKLLSLNIEPASQKIADILGITKGTPVNHLRRIRYADKTPVSLMENWIPVDVTDLSDEDFEKHGLYQLLRVRGTVIRVAKQRILARKATAPEADHLEVERGAALLEMERTSFDNSGRAVEHGHHVYRPDVFSFEVTLVER